MSAFTRTHPLRLWPMQLILGTLNRDSVAVAETPVSKGLIWKVCAAHINYLENSWFLHYPLTVWGHVFTGCSQGGKLTFENIWCPFNVARWEGFLDYPYRFISQRHLLLGHHCAIQIWRNPISNSLQSCSGAGQPWFVPDICGWVGPV